MSAVQDQGHDRQVDVVALVTSAGGLDALSAVLKGLPDDLPAAVVVQQHLGGQGSQLVEILSRRTSRTLRWADDGMVLVPGEVLVTRPRQQLEVLPDGSCASTEVAGPGDLPHDRLLASLADSFGPRALAVVLTGMGRDGSAGVRALKAAGGIVIAQDEETAEQPSMPRAAAAAGADLRLPLHEVAPVVAQVVRGGPLPRSRTEVEAAAELFAGPGEARAALRAVDWAATSLGPVSGWSEAWRTTVRTVLSNGFQMIAMLGPDYVQIGNDAFTPSLGSKLMQGVPARETWAEIWDDMVGPAFEEVRRTGRAILRTDGLVTPVRRGFREEAYFTYCYSPLYDEDGFAGILSTHAETTARVLAERRLATLRALAAAPVGSESVVLVCEQAVAAMKDNDRDLPFGLVYLVERDQRATLAGAWGVTPGQPAAPRVIDLTGGHPVWSLRQVLSTGEPLLVSDLTERAPGLPGGPWPQPAASALLYPLRPVAAEPAVGVLIAGLSPRLALDEPYRQFGDLLAQQVAAGLGEARARQRERERLAYLAELDRTKTEFFSNVSHEFRTPLTLMLAPLEQALQRAGELPEEVVEGLAVAQRNAMRLLRLVGTLLDFSRAEAGRLRARPVPVDLAALTAQTASMFRSAAEGAGLTLTVDSPPLDEPIWVDPQMWENVVSNLVSNALKFTWSGSVHVTLRALPQHIELVVRDTGVGIPEEQLPHVLKRFHRVPETRGRTHEGAGIGLALVDELVRRHHGRIRIRSELGQGTTVTVWMPRAHHPRAATDDPVPRTGELAAQMAEEAAHWATARERVSAQVDLTEPEVVPPRTPSTRRILVVDDNADMRDYLRRLLGSTWHVHTAADGAEALELARRDPPDLLLADVMMPVLDGFSLLAKIRADEALQHLPAVLLTARAGEESAIQGLLAGADDYVVKPFSARELVARVAAQLELAQQRRRAGELNAFRVTLTDRLSASHDRLEVLALGAELVGRHLGVQRAYYQEFDLEQGTFTIHHNYTEGVPSLAGTFDLEQFGDELVDSTVRRGRALVVVDAEELREPYRSSWAAVSARAGVAAPTLRDGSCVGALGVTTTTRREWSEEEVLLLQETADRIWAHAERARAEAALRASEERFRTVADAVPALIWQNDAQGANVFVNRYFLDYTGLPAGRITGEQWHDLIHPDEVDAYVAGYLRAVRERVPWHRRNRIRRHDGAWHTFDNYAAPLFTADGSYAGHVGVTIDITDANGHIPDTPSGTA